VLGVAATVIGLLALWMLQWFELRLRRQHRARLVVEWEQDAAFENTIRATLDRSGVQIVAARSVLTAAGRRREMVFDLLDYSLPLETHTPAFCEALAAEPGVVRLEWRRQ
jgi:uncharacterized membrane protein YhiD involved in acid resistance